MTSKKKYSKADVTDLLRADPPPGKRKLVRRDGMSFHLPRKGDIVNIKAKFNQTILLIVEADKDTIKGFRLRLIGSIDNIPDIQLTRSDYTLYDNETSGPVLRTISLENQEVLEILDLGPYNDRRDRIKRPGVTWNVIEGPDTEFGNYYEGVQSISLKGFTTERKARLYVKQTAEKHIAADVEGFQADIDEIRFDVEKFMNRETDFLRLIGYQTQYEIKALHIE